MATPIAIEVNNLSKKYKLYDKPTDRIKEALLPWVKQKHKEFFALNDINFSVKQGEALGIVGKNGSGKSTLLKILTGVLSPTEGSVSVNGKVSALLELGTGFNNDYTGLENIYLSGTLMGFTKEEMDKKVPEIVEFADIGDFLYQPVKTYSSGMYVRLAFAVAINVDPDILIIDEALSVGDIRFQRKCFRKIEEYKKTKTFILVSHDLTTITKFCDRAIWINEGVMRREGKPQDIVNEFRAFMIDAKFNKDGQEDLTAVDTNDFSNFIPIENRTEVMGDGKAGFDSYLFLDENGNKISVLPSGGMVQLLIVIEAYDDLEEAIVGFTLKDRLGNIVAQMNSFILDQSIALKNGEKYVAKFNFEMPKVRDGYYTFSPAVATGTQSFHVQHVWLFDAIVMEAINNQAINLEGMVYIDNASVEIERIG